MKYHKHREKENNGIRLRTFYRFVLLSSIYFTKMFHLQRVQVSTYIHTYTISIRIIESYYCNTRIFRLFWLNIQTILIRLHFRDAFKDAFQMN